MNKVKAFFKSAAKKTASVSVKTWRSLTSFFREPPFHVVKRGAISTTKALLIRAGAVVASLLFCTLLSMILINADPIKFLSSIFNGAFGSSRRIWKLAKDTAVLLCIAVAITPAFRMRFWNIGAEGQTLMGALAAAGVAHYLGGSMGNGILILLMFIAAVIIGGIWGVVPAIFKAKWNTNETLFTLMMNYIASGLVAYFLLLWTPSGSSVLGEIPYGHIPSVINAYFPLIIAVLIITVLAFVYLKYTKQGYEISVVGESENTAKYIGINVGKVIIRTMIISGAVCGIAGFLIVGSLDHSVSTTTVGGLGFTAIMVSWLAKFNPLVMIGTSMLLVFLNQGTSQITTEFNIASAFPDMVIGIVLFFVIGCEFFINYAIKPREKAAKEGR